MVKLCKFLGYLCLLFAVVFICKAYFWWFKLSFEAAAVCLGAGYYPPRTFAILPAKTKKKGGVIQP